MEEKNKCILISVNMGYGHQRAAFPLLDISGGKQRIFGEEDFVKGWSKFLWKSIQRSYNFFSSAGRIPFVGKLLLGFLERFEKIPHYYPVRDLSRPSLQTRVLKHVINTSFGRDFFKHINSNERTHTPVLSTFYTSAMAAERHTGLDIYCLICDADIHRIWVSNDPESSRIRYLAPCSSAKRRLMEYGVPEERINITGFPLPNENIGGENMKILNSDMAERMKRLDPEGEHVRDSRLTELFNNIEKDKDKDKGKDNENNNEKDIDISIDIKKEEKKAKLITITYAVGGAGAQKEIAYDILKSIKPQLNSGKYKINLVAGTRQDVKQYFLKLMMKMGPFLNKSVNIIYEENLNDYFKAFNQALRSTDILWTKPSELSFYCGLGIPFIISPSIGAQEDGNKKWLLEIGAGFDQGDAAHCGEWISDMINDGVMARLAWNGYINAPKSGTKNISDILTISKR